MTSPIKKSIVVSILLLWTVVLTAQVKTGLDVLVAEQFKRLHGRRVGLVINRTAVDHQGRSIIELFAGCPDIKVVALFGPEHGLQGRCEAGELLQPAADSLTGAPIYSLYGENLKPTLEMLNGIDVLVFDMQDVGTRFFTYISTLYMAMEAAAEAHISFMVLDRPNPIGGVVVEGPVLKKEFESFVGIQPISLRHGMTIGELAGLFNGESRFKNAGRVSLSVVKLKGWRRDCLFEKAGLPWIKPSPNMTSLQTALLYPGMGLLEATNLSEGRGTQQPFVMIGAPWIDADKLIAQLGHDPAMIKVSPALFTPVSLPNIAAHPKYQGRPCQGLQLKVLQPKNFKSVQFGVQLLAAVRRLYPDSVKFNEPGMNRLAGDSRIFAALQAGRSTQEIREICDSGLRSFLKIRKKYLLY